MRPSPVHLQACNPSPICIAINRHWLLLSSQPPNRAIRLPGAVVIFVLNLRHACFQHDLVCLVPGPTPAIACNRLQSPASPTGSQQSRLLGEHHHHHHHHYLHHCLQVCLLPALRFGCHPPQHAWLLIRPRNLTIRPQFIYPILGVTTNNGC